MCGLITKRKVKIVLRRLTFWGLPTVAVRLERKCSNWAQVKYPLRLSNASHIRKVLIQHVHHYVYDVARWLMRVILGWPNIRFAVKNLRLILKA